MWLRGRKAVERRVKGGDRRKREGERKGDNGMLLAELKNQYASSLNQQFGRL